ncbi:hypothetical protein QCA50_003322 [Cerrena zonata]|uniref:Uncharacterized protein n=1 Tax=Cerrena zonata TaxID=2478898 RepID=A0AAW0GKJ4_9APHY
MSPTPDSIITVDSAVLISTLDSIDYPPYHLASSITLATRSTVRQLRIILVSPLFNPSPPADFESGGSELQYGVSRTSRWDEVQRLLTYVYVQATRVAQEMGRILMDVDVLLHGSNSEVPGIAKESVQRVYEGACTLIITTL